MKMQHSQTGNRYVSKYTLQLNNLPMTMLEYFKLILVKVSFDPALFRMEFKKAVRKLVDEEIAELKKWCIETFGLSYCLKVDPSFSM